MIKIYTFAHKRPDFLDMQLKSFKKNIEDEFQFIVFNNAAFDLRKNHYNEIHTFCKSNNIQCIDIKRDSNLVNKLRKYNNEHIFNNEGLYCNPSIACAYPLCWAWENVISKTDDKICIIDSDMFFVEKENLSNYFNQYDIIYMPQSRGPNGEVYYMWNGISFMNLKNMPEKSSLDWWCGYVDGQPVDVGGHTFYYLQKHKDSLKFLELKLHYVGEDETCDFSPANYEYFQINEKKCLLHMRGGSNWDLKSSDYHVKKTRWFKNKLGQ